MDTDPRSRYGSGSTTLPYLKLKIAEFKMMWIREGNALLITYPGGQFITDPGGQFILEPDLAHYQEISPFFDVGFDSITVFIRSCRLPWSRMSEITP